MSANDNFTPETRSLLGLPNEILLEICEKMPDKDLISLRCCNKRLQSLVDPVLFATFYIKLKFLSGPEDQRMQYERCKWHGWYDRVHPKQVLFSPCTGVVRSWSLQPSRGAHEKNDKIPPSKCGYHGSQIATLARKYGMPRLWRCMWLDPIIAKPAVLLRMKNPPHLRYLKVLDVDLDYMRGITSCTVLLSDASDFDWEGTLDILKRRVFPKLLEEGNTPSLQEVYIRAQSLWLRWPEKKVWPVLELREALSEMQWMRPRVQLHVAMSAAAIDKENIQAAIGFFDGLRRMNSLFFMVPTFEVVSGLKTSMEALARISPERAEVVIRAETSKGGNVYTVYEIGRPPAGLSDAWKGFRDVLLGKKEYIRNAGY